ncbi:hydrogenase expression/formation protein HypE [Oscillochloris trichoides DG-6]|uniref:Hydrogenase expression/formation protein HypE n=1 Tax=Oscillochloris trichoides DG-6 TaxID=765420 RepID=E1IH10_9CHLR|nr:hydrogenase expression/formation protein HypE [Oscillochloris trichoides]EFO79485.1 hydrogenase expression/formation protein HypE [Oscillochloris trichoides DG-6]
MIDLDGWVCPAPLRDYPTIVMGHGGGGKLSAELVEHIFLPAFQNGTLAQLGDSALLEVGAARLAFSTDSFVVRPLFFPGGTIGDLAVNGTINDLAMSGAQPLYLSAGFILEEGLPITQLAAIAERMGAAARNAGVTLVTGDTKVVDRGHGDGVYITTSGIGVVPAGLRIAPDQARPGDVVLVSGEIGLHGMAIMSVREGLEFGTPLMSDCAPLHDLVATMLAANPNIHALRDPTRGGLAATLNEIARASGVGVRIIEAAVPIPAEVRAACEMLGLDPFYVANEGKLVAFVAREAGEAVLAAMRAHPLGRNATIIGEVVAEHPGMVVARTGIGGTRVVDTLVGEQLPRIC